MVPHSVVIANIKDQAVKFCLYVAYLIKYLHEVVIDAGTHGNSGLSTKLPNYSYDRHLDRFQTLRYHEQNPLAWQPINRASPS